MVRINYEQLASCIVEPVAGMDVEFEQALDIKMYRQSAKFKQALDSKMGMPSVQMDPPFDSKMGMPPDQYNQPLNAKLGIQPARNKQPWQPGMGRPIPETTSEITKKKIKKEKDVPVFHFLNCTEKPMKGNGVPTMGDNQPYSFEEKISTDGMRPSHNTDTGDTHAENNPFLFFEQNGF